MWRRASLTVLAALLAGAAWWFTVGAPRLRSYAPPVSAIAPGDPVRGQHLAAAIAVCTICHGENLAGKLAFEDAFLGRGYTPNLTAGQGGIGRTYTDADWVRAIRFGVKPDGRGILFMPADHYNAMTDTDLGALIAYLKALPAVDNTQTRLDLGLPARLLLDLGLAGDVVRAAVIDLQATPWKTQADPGAYLIALGGCTFCHGKTLVGGQGPEPGAPNGPPLRHRGWTLESFAASLRAGQAPDGHRINPKYMPWQGYAHMTDDEVALVFQALR